MNDEILLGNLGGDEFPQSPINLVREEAAALTARYKDLLIAFASVPPMPAGSPLVMCTLIISVPEPNYYEVAILSFSQPLQLYPVFVTDLLQNKRAECVDSTQFRAVVAEILTSDAAQKVFAELWGQVQRTGR